MLSLQWGMSPELSVFSVLGRNCNSNSSSLKETRSVLTSHVLKALDEIRLCVFSP